MVDGNDDSIRVLTVDIDIRFPRKDNGKKCILGLIDLSVIQALVERGELIGHGTSKGLHYRL